MLRIKLIIGGGYFALSSLRLTNCKNLKWRLFQGTNGRFFVLIEAQFLRHGISRALICYKIMIIFKGTIDI